MLRHNPSGHDSHTFIPTVKQTLLPETSGVHLDLGLRKYSSASEGERINRQSGIVAITIAVPLNSTRSNPHVLHCSIVGGY